MDTPVLGRHNLWKFKSTGKILSSDSPTKKNLNHIKLFPLGKNEKRFKATAILYSIFM